MVCNDYFNTEECCFDLGDCCDPNADKLPSSCSECKCKSENGLASLLTPDTPLGPCQPESFISDGFCDDSLNFPICEFDGGDCCSSTSDYAFCSVCLCVSHANFTEPMAYSDKCQISWIGDGVCDDVNNNEGCFYDEDDCCGDKGQTQFDYCTICQCYEKQINTYLIQVQFCTGALVSYAETETFQAVSSSVGIAVEHSRWTNPVRLIDYHNSILARLATSS